VITAGLEFGQRRFAPGAFRVTVASFNARALRVVTSLGFRPASSFTATTDGRPFEILVRDCRAAAPAATARP
jgi:ribosomal-protein-alanine N-acetyltransferase